MEHAKQSSTFFWWVCKHMPLCWVVKTMRGGLFPYILVGLQSMASILCCSSCCNFQVRLVSLQNLCSVEKIYILQQFDRKEDLKVFCFPLRCVWLKLASFPWRIDCNSIFCFYFGPHLGHSSGHHSTLDSTMPLQRSGKELGFYWISVYTCGNSIYKQCTHIYLIWFMNTWSIDWYSTVSIEWDIYLTTVAGLID